jgi:exopolysaccharide biosynthesis polyprenyl glycosylphosphotransferase
MQVRLALAGLMLWDLIVTVTTYNVVFWRRLGSWPGLTSGLSVMVLVWISSSYLLGRYSARVTTESFSTKLLRLGLVMGIVLGLFIAHSWLFQVTDAGTRFRGFLIPLLVLVASFSFILQLGVKGVRRQTSNWLLIISDEERRLLEGDKAMDLSLSLFTPQFLDSAQFEALLLQEDSAPKRWDGVTVALSDQVHLSEKAIERLLALRAKGIRICTLLDWCEIALQRVPSELIDQRWFIAAEGFNIQPGRIGWRLKRLVDVIGALALIVLTTPLMLLAMALIRLEDGGPVFYTQIRTGLYGERMKIWKFRSMRVDAESRGIQWASRGDSRVTKCGSLLRQLRIDELPQLFAVLAGELSLIGPRPERPELEVDLEEVIPHYRIRHWIRPGLSGWAQVNYPYGASVEDSKAKLSFDLFYIRNAGFWLDALIVLKTMRLVAGAKGAQPRS